MCLRTFHILLHSSNLCCIHHKLLINTDMSGRQHRYSDFWCQRDWKWAICSPKIGSMHNGIPHVRPNRQLLGVLTHKISKSVLLIILIYLLIQECNMIQPHSCLSINWNLNPFPKYIHIKNWSPWDLFIRW